MTVAARTFIRFSSGVFLLIFVLTVLSPFLSAQEMEFNDVKKRGIVEDKVVETANLYADVVQFDIKGKVKDTTITEIINVIVPKGHMTPQEIMLENIYELITIGAGPWVFIWAKPPSPHGVKAYHFKLRNPNSREVMLDTTVEKNYVVVPQRNRTFSGRKQMYWYWTVTAIGSDNAKGLSSIRGFYLKELGK